MKKPCLLAAALALAAAGCDSQPEAPVDGDISATENSRAAAASGDAASSEGAGGAASAANEFRAIPARFLGAWDSVGGNCDPASDLRMEIGQRRIVFYESVGDVTDIRAENDNAILVTMSMSGEGESWKETTRLTLVDGGDRLVPSSADDEDAYEPMPRKRCAA